MIGDFELKSELGRGAAAITFEARQLSQERLVALKVLHPALAARPERVARFHAEAALAARIDHPGIVRVLSVGSRDGRVYFAMELAAGPTLAQFIDRAVGARGESFFRDAALRFAELARAVEALHGAGIVHRKLRPANLFLEEDRIRLTDFELAADLAAGEAPPEQPLRDGTLAASRIYLAPEEFVRGGRPSPAADIYSLGMTLYELATGLLPFPRCSDEELGRLKLTRRPLAPRRLNPEVPLGLEAVIRQAIESSPALRHASAEELASDLERFAAQKRGPTRHHGPAAGSGPSGDGGDASPDLARIA